MVKHSRNGGQRTQELTQSSTSDEDNKVIDQVLCVAHLHLQGKHMRSHRMMSGSSVKYIQCVLKIEHLPIYISLYNAVLILTYSLNSFMVTKTIVNY